MAGLTPQTGHSLPTRLYHKRDPDPVRIGDDELGKGEGVPLSPLLPKVIARR